MLFAHVFLEWNKNISEAVSASKIFSVNVKLQKLP